MSLSSNKSIVAKIFVRSVTYYIGSNRHGGITLDNEDYLPLITQVGNASNYGNFGEGNEIGSCSVTMINGEQWMQGNYLFNIGAVWNNRECELRLCDPNSETSWGDCEEYYKGIIKNFSIGDGTISFDIDAKDYRDDAVLPQTVINGGTYSNAPEKSFDKRIPMNYGRLEDENNGIFGKGLVTDKRIGQQEILFDKESLSTLEEIGIWSESLEKYFKGNTTGYMYTGTYPNETPVETNEYRINDNRNGAVFYVDSGIKLTELIDSTVEGIETIKINNYNLINWVDEGDIDESNFPKLLSVNIISIDDEFMLIVNKPDSNTIWVERGFNDTEITTHANGSIVYQSSTYCAKNLLSFTHRFVPKALTNFYYYTESGETLPNEIIRSGSWSNIINDNSGFLVIEPGVGADIVGAINLDMKFQNIEEDYSIAFLYPALTYEFFYDVPIGQIDQIKFLIYDPSVATARDVSSSDTTSDMYVMSYIKRTGTGTFPVVTHFTPKRIRYDNGDYGYSGNLNFYFSTPFTSLRDLNKKIKIAIRDVHHDNSNYVQVYNIGLWVDFFVDFTDKRIVAPLAGRIMSPSDIALADTSLSAGTLASSPSTILTNILINEMGYNTNDFDTTSWQNVYTYYNDENQIGTTIPAGAMSWGIDDKEQGMKLCQEIASHFMLTIVKRADGTMKLINLHKLQNTNTTYGYSSMTSYKISLDDILMPGTNRLLKIKQTGTDRIRNVVNVHYKRNNSTDEYQATYTVPDTYTMPQSGITLANARNYYYDREETESLDIESPFIYAEADAQRLAEWHINDKAEIFFWAEFTIHYDHYTNVNSKSEQYEIGDVIYFDGVYSGLTLNSTHLWVIRDTIKKDDGREIEIHCKSIEPISQFTTNVTAQNDTIQDVVTGSTDAWQDVVDLGTDAVQDKT